MIKVLEIRIIEQSSSTMDFKLIYWFWVSITIQGLLYILTYLIPISKPVWEGLQFLLQISKLRLWNFVAGWNGVSGLVV